MIRSKIPFFLLLLCSYSLSFSQYEEYEGGYGEYEGAVDAEAYEGDDEGDGDYQDGYEGVEVDPLALPDTAANARRGSPASERATAAALRSIPLFQNPLPTFTIDPANPTLPENHAFLKLRGTIWRGSEQILTTNQRGVVTPQRMYVVFAKDRDAATFAIAPFSSSSITSYPPIEDYVPLIPVIETNSFRASPYTDKYIEIPEEYTRPTTNNLFLLDPNLSNLSSTEAENSETTTFTPPPVAAPPVEAEIPVQLDDAYGDGGEYGDAGYGDGYGDAGYGDGYDGYSFAPNIQELTLFAQNAGGSSTISYAVVNIGGLNSGVFQMNDPSNAAAPFIILMMVLDVDGSLWAGIVRSSVDMRLNTAEAGQLRELYKKNLINRVNLKKYSPVSESENRATSIFNFFK
ncbi:MAG: hypothetical protein ACRC9L_08930 [Brevinema sp.]